MNERIQKLGVDAGLYVDVNGHYWPTAMSAEECEAAYEKFAELIIQECYRAVLSVPCYYKDYRSQIEKTVVNDCACAVKEHFGAEGWQ